MHNTKKHTCEKKMTQITRERHMSYMTRLTPILIAAYVLQSFLYYKFGPPQTASEVTISIGICLCAMIMAFIVHDSHHKVILHPNYIEIRFDILKYQREILYRQIESVEVKESKHSFSDLKITLLDGSEFKILHVDEGQKLKELLLRKK